MKRKNKTAVGLFVVSFVFNFIETAYFGFNWTPQSPAEVACDMACYTLDFIGGLIIISNFWKKGLNININ